MKKDFDDFIQYLDSGKTEEILNAIETKYEEFSTVGENDSINLAKLTISSSYFAALEMVKNYHEWLSQRQE